MELKNFEITQKISEAGDPNAEINKVNTKIGVIPANTQIKTNFCAKFGNEDEQVRLSQLFIWQC